MRISIEQILTSDTQKEIIDSGDSKIYTCENCPFDFKTIHPSAFRDHRRKHKEEGFVRHPLTRLKVNHNGIRHECKL